MEKRQTFIGWNYAKKLIYEYGKPTDNRLKEYQQKAIQEAISKTQCLENGKDILSFLDLVFWNQNLKITDACMICGIDQITGKRWHTNFIRLVCINLDLS